MSDTPATELDAIRDLYLAARDEAQDFLDRVVENVGGAVVKPGSPTLAILYAFDEVAQRLWAAVEREQRLRYQVAKAQVAVANALVADLLDE